MTGSQMYSKVRYWFTFLSVLSPVFFSSRVLAETNILMGTLAIEKELERQVEKVIKGYDDNSIVFVKALPKKPEPTSLPGTDFVIADNRLTSQNFLEFSSITIDVYTSLDKIPPKAEEIIIKQSTNFGVEPEIAIFPLPENFSTLASSTTATAIDNATQEALSQEKDLFNKVQTTIYIGVGTGAFFLIAFIVFGVVIIRGSKNNLKTIDEASKKLANAIEESAGGGAVQNVQTSNRESRHKEKAESTDNQTNVFESLPVSNLLAIMFDCYWCHEDSYAHFMWSKLATKQKTDLLSESEVVPTYVNFFTQIAPNDINAVSDPYYLNPEEINFVSNDSLTEQIRKTPQLFSKISSLRTENLTLSAIEVIQLKKIIAEKPEDDGVSFTADESPEFRVLTRRHEIVVKDDEEEKQLLEYEDLPDTEKPNIVTLVWAKDIDDDSLEGIIASFSAADLASAWLGDNDTLERFKTLMPEKKKNMLERQITKTTASRDSDAYRRLHQMICEKLKSPINEQPAEQKIGLNQIANQPLRNIYEVFRLKTRKIWRLKQISPAFYYPEKMVFFLFS